MKITLEFWYAKLSNDYWTRTNARRDMRHRLRDQTTANPKGKGNKAWKRYEALMNDPDCIVWPEYAL